MAQMFGKFGLEVYHLFRGHDERPVEPHRELAASREQDGPHWAPASKARMKCRKWNSALENSKINSADFGRL